MKYKQQRAVDAITGVVLVFAVVFMVVVAVRMVINF